MQKSDVTVIQLKYGIIIIIILLLLLLLYDNVYRWCHAVFVKKMIVFPVPFSPHGCADLRFCGLQPDTSRSCKTMDTGPVCRTVCLFTSKLMLSWCMLVFIISDHCLLFSPVEPLSCSEFYIFMIIFTYNECRKRRKS